MEISWVLKNEAVLPEMGLINWALSEVMKRGFTPLITPEIVRSSVVEKCGFQPRGQNTQVILLTDKLIHRDKGQETSATFELNKPKLPLRKPVNDVAEVKEHDLPIIVPKQEDLSSANSAIFDSDSPHYTDGGHSSLLEPANSSNIFEPDHSDLSHADEDEEDHLSRDDVYPDPPVNSCFYSFPVEDQVCCYWPY